MSGAYVRHFEHESELLRDNPLGDPAVRRVPVYLPPDYSDRRKEPYPVVFLLSGWGGRGAGYLGDGGAFAPSLPDQLDQAVLDRSMLPTIVVFPDCTTRLGGSQYVNSSGSGPYMDYVCDELCDWVDQRFHTHRSREFRGVVGHSSGGFGALAFAMLRSDRFAAACCSSGDCWFENLYLAPLPMMVRVLERAGGVSAFLERFLSSPNPMGLLGREEVVTMATLAMCSCFAPNRHVPLLRGDLYFDPETGEIVDDVWRRFLDWDPLRMVERHQTALKSLRLLRLEAGADDEFGLQLGHRQLSRRLGALGVGHEFDEYPGRHGGHQHRMAGRIGRLAKALLGS